MQRDVWPSAICFLGGRCKGDTESRNGCDLLLQNILKGFDDLGGRTIEARVEQDESSEYRKNREYPQVESNLTYAASNSCC